MEAFKYPNKKEWQTLCERPAFEQESLNSLVNDILKDVKINKDSALKKYSEKFDKVILDNIEVSKTEIETANSQINQDLKDAINLAKQNIEVFHASQKEEKKLLKPPKVLNVGDNLSV